MGNNDIIFYVAGGVLDSDRTEIYKYKESYDLSFSSWEEIKVDLNLNFSIGFSFFQSYQVEKTEFLVLGGGLHKDFYTKSNVVRIINPKVIPLIKAYKSEKEDYFFDNQVLDIQQELYVVGYVHTWKFIKTNGEFAKHQTNGLKYKLGKTSKLIMPE